MSDLPGINEDNIIALEKKLAELENQKRIDLDYIMRVNQLQKNDKTHQALHDKAFKQLSELRKALKDHSKWQKEQDTLTEMELKELKEQIHKLYSLPSKMLINKAVSGMNREVLRDHLKSHIVVAREQLTDKDKMTIFKEFDNAIEDQLKKLEGDSNWNPTLGDGIPSDARFPATDSKPESIVPLQLRGVPVSKKELDRIQPEEPTDFMHIPLSIRTFLEKSNILPVEKPDLEWLLTPIHREERGYYTKLLKLQKKYLKEDADE